jgi:hypothetical protein
MGELWKLDELVVQRAPGVQCDSFVTCKSLNTVGRLGPPANAFASCRLLHGRGIHAEASSFAQCSARMPLVYVKRPGWSR